MSERKPCASDLSDERWALIEPVITAWKAAHSSVSGHQGRYAMREIVNAILYQSRTGCQWNLLPHDLPPRSAVYYYYPLWRDDRTDQAIHDLLRWQTREKKGRLADPSLAVLDTQSVLAAAGVPAGTTGKDAGKRVPGRKRGLAVDVLGLVIAVVVLAASAHENVAGTALWSPNPQPPRRRRFSARPESGRGWEADPATSPAESAASPASSPPSLTWPSSSSTYWPLTHGPIWVAEPRQVHTDDLGSDPYFDMGARTATGPAAAAGVPSHGIGSSLSGLAGVGREAIGERDDEVA